MSNKTNLCINSEDNCILNTEPLIMCKWLCSCFYTKDKKIDKTVKSKKRGKIQTEDKTKETNQKTMTQIGSFYGKKDENTDKTTVTDLSSASLIPEADLIRTYNLPFENCKTINQLMRDLGYELQSEVGKGGFGLVRKCIHIDKNKGERKVLACKQIILKDQMIKALKSEIFILKKCKFPYIIGLEDCFITICEGKSMAHMFMEFADGDTLQLEINNGPLADIEAKRYFAQTATALAYLHRLKIAHKDLKPENILLITNEKTGLKDVRVGDFGLSQSVYKEKKGIIKSGHFGGTRAYMAPEILRMEIYKADRKLLALQYDPFKSDLWALGICLFEMLTKTLPFDYYNLNNMLLIEEKKSFSYPRGVRDSIDPKADNLIRELLEPDVTKRIDPIGVLTHPWIKDEVDLSMIQIPNQSNQ